MQIVSVKHKMLRSYIQTGQPKGIDSRISRRLLNMIAFLTIAKDMNALRIPPNFGFHILTGNRAGTAAMTITKNWRLTFRLDEYDRVIDLDLEDYH
jgi:toxin HigB-1